MDFNADDMSGMYIMEYVTGTIDVIGNSLGFWRQIFPIATKELVLLPDNIKCGYNLMIYIIQKTLNIYYTIEMIKKTLSKKYKIHNQYLKQIKKILSLHGIEKNTMMSKVNTMDDLDVIIMRDEYYLSNLDIWMIADSLNLPIILFSSKDLSNLLLKRKWIIMGGEKTEDSYFFIRSLVEKGTIPQYNLIRQVYKISDLNNSIIGNDGPREEIDIENYLQSV
jgi:hypothetical protein